MGRVMEYFDDDEPHPDYNKPFYCPNCGNALGWYDDCGCTENLIIKISKL